MSDDEKLALAKRRELAGLIKEDKETKQVVVKIAQEQEVQNLHRLLSMDLCPALHL
ncbi:hypothetical protein K466DRAFT_606196 [Polyporus arcularius HHB13444]|uniref:Uncharacterized protein n=1 Tax=Polyporus arcularius HHB13444 TaxID=1314778 RepID=A0A5C3NP00_9APHY|nr:hypothetical protein K466DRAFT_606196 [Polyporus arcularius HHB13444]